MQIYIYILLACKRLLRLKKFALFITVTAVIVNFALFKKLMGPEDNTLSILMVIQASTYQPVLTKKYLNIGYHMILSVDSAGSFVKF